MPGIFVGMNNAIMGGLNSVLEGQSSIFSSMINTISVSSFTIFIIWRGYQTLAGKLMKPMEDVVWDSARMMLIMLFVLNRGGWLDITITAINGLKDGFSGGDDVWTVLDTLWETVQKLGEKLYSLDKSPYVPLQGAIADFLVWAGAIFIFITATVVNELAEITILLMSTTAPVFIFCLSYGFLRPMFDNWLKIIFTAILTIMFSALFLRTVIKYITDVLAEATATVDDSNMITLAAQVLMACIGSGVLIWFAAKIAQALGGVMTQATMQSIAKASADNAIKPVRNAAGAIGDKAAKNFNDTAGSQREASIRSMQYLNKNRSNSAKN